jgi:molecular chaperone GrpE
MNTDDDNSITETGAQTKPAEEASEDSSLQALQQELAEQKKQSAYHREQWMRSAANLENYKKRVEKERSELLKLGQGALIAQLLAVLDDLERAILTLPAPLHALTWSDGLALIERKLHLVLEQHGLKEIESLGKAFDPTVHQSILVEETTEYPDGEVMAVLQKGYLFHDRVMRPAMVRVARSPAGTQPQMPSTAAKDTPDETREDSS